MHEFWDQSTTVLRTIWFNRKYIPLLAWLIAPAAWLVIINLPDQYKAEAQIFVDTQSQLKPLLQGLTVDTDPDTQIRMIAKTLKARPILKQVVEDSDLSLYIETDDDYENFYQLLNKKLKLKAARKENLFNLSFQFHDPVIAKTVLDSVIKIFVERTLGENRTEGDSARRFLQSQVDDYEQRLRSADQALTQFKRKYAGLLPTDGGSFQSMLNRQNMQLSSAQLELQQLLTRLSSAKSQLSSEPKYLSAVSQTGEIYTQYDARLLQQKGLLDELSLKYTDNHPDIIELKRKIKELTKLQQTEIKSKKRNNRKPHSGSTINPLYQELKLLVSQYSADIASQQVKVQNLKSKTEELNLRKDKMPQVEAELLDLTRGYSITKNKYEELLVRKETADLAQQADRNAEEIQFKIIDPPRIPLSPVGPKRLLFIVMAMLAALGAGVGLAFVLNQINPVISNTKELAQIAGVPVFGTVSKTEKALHLREKKKSHLVFSISMTLLLIMFLIMVASQLNNQVSDLLTPLKFMRN